MKQESDSLLSQHQERLAQSAIRADVIKERGYRSVISRADLRRLGFGEQQCRVPALLIPIWSVRGEIVLYQIRPDTPRISDRKPIKYETVRGGHMALDVPPSIRGQLGDPKIPLLITEGPLKADAAVSKGLCCIALLGVWNFRGTNDDGGKVVLADWDAIALNGRTVYIVFDSDVMEKLPVYKALIRLKALLESRGAFVSIIYLPPGEHGAKVGVDDFFAAGHTVAEFLALASAQVRKPPSEEDETHEPICPYLETPAGLMWCKHTREGEVRIPLTNFTAHIVADVAQDDGAEVQHVLNIDASLNGRTTRCTVPARQFLAMTWPMEHLGAQAIVYPGLSVKDHARGAIQLLSGEVPERRVYAHTGWRKHDEVWIYLHAGGAIGAEGAIEGLEVHLPESLARYRLPAPPEGAALVEAITASLRVMDLGPASVTVPLYGAIWRAALGNVDFSVHIAGPTGTGKSEISALIQQHYGAEMTARHLPGSWCSTGNALEALAHATKDAVLVIDDFAPAGTAADMQRLHRDADRVLRAQGNNAGRHRLRADATLKPMRFPRGLILSTGEDVPKGQSLRARSVVLELSPGALNWNLLTSAQTDAEAGLYAQTFAAFVRWLAPRYEDWRSRLRTEITILRQQPVGPTQHRRTPEILANLGAGIQFFLTFAQESGALSPETSAALWGRCQHALGEAAWLQDHHQATQEPAQRFLDLIAAALAAGRAHVSVSEGREPRTTPEAWGWRSVTIGTGEDLREEWRPQRERIGWMDGDDLYLEPVASYSVAQQLARDSADHLCVSVQTLRRRLKERGSLASTDEARGTLTVRRRLDGVQRNVLHLHITTLTGYPSSQANKSDKVDIAQQQPTNQRSTDVKFVGFVGSQSETNSDRRAEDKSQRSKQGNGEYGSADQSSPNGGGPCHACGSTRFWQSKNNGLVICATCHPPADLTLVAGWLTGTEDPPQPDRSDPDRGQPGIHELAE